MDERITMKLLILVPILFLTGCGCTSHCILGFGPGNPAFNAMGKHYNTIDTCQHIGKPEGYQLPGYCFANANKRVYYVRDVNNRIVYTVR